MAPHQSGRDAMKETIRIPYPDTAAGKKLWAKRYGTNAYWAGKHHAVRTEDAKYWHALTLSALNRAHIRKHPFDRPVVISFLWNDNLDIDNHSIMGKMIVDALRGRVINNDNRRWLRGVEHYWHDAPYIEIIVREID